MFGQTRQGANMYATMGLETGVLAASPNKLVIMLYDGAISACRGAIVSLFGLAASTPVSRPILAYIYAPCLDCPNIV